MCLIGNEKLKRQVNETQPRCWKYYLKQDPRHTNPFIRKIAEKISRKMIQSYIFFLDEELANFFDLQYELIRKSALKYLPNLIDILLVDAALRQPNYSSPHYTGQSLGIGIILPNLRAQKLNRALPLASFKKSKEQIESLLKSTDEAYEQWSR